MTLVLKQVAELVANRELRQSLIPVVKSITLTGTSAMAIQGDYIVLRCDGYRIRYRITMAIPDETNEGSVTLYLALDRVLDAHE